MSDNNVLVIDRSKWRTGGYSGQQTGSGDTNLLNADGFMCCLGFECIRRGHQKEEILTMAEPCKIGADIDLLTRRIDYDEGDSVVIRNTEFTLIAMEINDNEDITSQEREVKIIEHFATANIQVEFIGEYK